MKGKKLYGGLLLSVGLMTALVSGCTERDLLDRPSDGPLKVNIDWPEGADGQTVDVTGATIYLYGSDGQLFKVFNTSAEGMQERIPAGTYTVLVINSDNEHADCHDESSSSSCCVDADETEVAGILENVDRVYCTGMTGVTVNPGNAVTEITLQPVNVVKTITFNVDPNYLDGIASITLNMTGVVPGVHVMNGTYTSDPTGAVEADVTENPDGTYTATMTVFGWEGTNEVTAHVTYADGTPDDITIPIDITDELADLPDEGGSIDIVLELENGGEIRLTVTVAAWDDTGTGGGIVM